MHKLPKETVRLISSSQVISSVSSVVKECVENSLDAGAKSIEVKLESFGLDKIEVKDDGLGMNLEDARLMAKPHYTSKLEEFTDLTSITSYGFRGEALGSLTAVSELSVITREKGTSLAHHFSYDSAGNVKSEKAISFPEGTQVSASNLFKMVPVRRQSYTAKRKKQELSDVETYVKAFGVIHPHISISLRHDKVLLWRKGTCSDVQTSLVLVFGSAAGNKLKRKSVSLGDGRVTIEAVLPCAEAAKQEYLCQRSPSRLFVIVNKKPVKMKAMEKVIRQYFTAATGRENKFPIGYFHITVPPSQIDINLEPNKTNVLFVDEELIMKATTSILEQFYGEIIPSASAGSSPTDSNKQLTEDGVTAAPEVNSHDVTSGVINLDIEMETDRGQPPGEDSGFSSFTVDRSGQNQANKENELIETPISKTNDQHLNNTEVSSGAKHDDHTGIPVCNNNIDGVSSCLNSLPPVSSMLAPTEQSSPYRSLFTECRSNSESGHTGNNTWSAETTIPGSIMDTSIKHSTNTLTAMRNCDVENEMVSGSLIHQSESHRAQPHAETLISSEHSKSAAEVGSLIRQHGLTECGSSTDILMLDDSSTVASSSVSVSGSSHSTPVQQSLGQVWSKGQFSSVQPVTLHVPSNNNYSDGSMTPSNKTPSRPTGNVHKRKQSSTPASNSKKHRSNEGDLVELFKRPPPPPKDDHRNVKNYPSVKVAFSLDNIEKQLKRAREEPNLKDGSYPSWIKFKDGYIVSRQSGHLETFNPYRAKESEIYQQLLGSFSLPCEDLPSPVLIEESSFLDDLGLWDTFLSLTFDHTPPDPHDHLNDVRFTHNGLYIRKDKESEDLHLWKTASEIPFFGIKDLKEILHLLKANPARPLADCRPEKIRQYLQGETVRIVRSMQPMSTVEAEEQDDNTFHTCIHEKPIRTQLWPIKNNAHKSSLSIHNCGLPKTTGINLHA